MSRAEWVRSHHEREQKICTLLLGVAVGRHLLPDPQKEGGVRTLFRSLHVAAPIVSLGYAALRHGSPAQGYHNGAQIGAKLSVHGREDKVIEARTAKKNIQKRKNGSYVYHYLYFLT